MKTRAYAIEDHDVLDTFFGEEQPERPVADLGADHGTLIFEGSLSDLPQEGEVFVVNDCEYVVMLRLFHTDGSADLILHQRHFEGGHSS